MNPQGTFSEQLDEYLQTFFASRVESAGTIHPQYQQLWQELARVTLNGGKRLRPTMAKMSYEACGGNDVAYIIPAAAALEILHSSLLIHDDIIDRESIRRGEKNVSGAYEARHYTDIPASERRHYSDSAALLGGDLLLTASLQLIDECVLPADALTQAKSVLHRIIFEVAAGQLLDCEAGILPLQDIDVLTIARYKTASYSYVGPLLIGAVLAGNTESSSDIVAFATYLGIAFQLNDDLISTFGDESLTGKSTDSDLREGKRTYVVEHFLSHGTPESIKTFRNHFGQATLSSQQADALKELLIDSGAVSATEKIIDEYVADARAALDSMSLSDNGRSSFESLISLSVKRSV